MKSVTEEWPQSGHASSDDNHIGLNAGKCVSNESRLLGTR